MSPRGQSRAFLLPVLAAVLATVPSSSHAQSVSYVGSVLFTTGDYGLPRATTSLALVNGVALTANRLRGWLSFPLVLQNAGWVQYGGAGMVPSGGLQGHGHGGMMDRDRGGMRGGAGDGGGMTSHVGVGDPFARAEYEVLSGSTMASSLRVVGAVKAPVARPDNGLGTGRWDYGAGLAWSESVRGSYLFADATYWAIGRPDSVAVTNPLAYSLAIGRPLGRGTYAMLASISGSTPVVDGFAAPVQAGVGLSYRASERRYLTGTLGIGLTKTAPSIALGIGWQLGLLR